MMRISSAKATLKRSFLVGLALLVGLSTFSGINYLLSRSTDAAPAGWSAGRIIDDSVFTAHSSMSASSIQSFLNSKVPTCDTNGQQVSEFGGTDLNKDGKIQRWEWGKQKYNQTVFRCLKDYTQNGKKASQIIYDVAQKYKISPKVLLVLLQKEQALVTDTWPINIQYRSATGYGCPDTAPCDSQYYGLTNQLDWAAKMFRSIMDDTPTWYTPYVLGNNSIQYNPDARCGSSTVNIQNRATQALYNYTPYQPNTYALNGGSSSAYPNCGAFGNRNFYTYFTSWFGTTQAQFINMSDARYMEVSRPTNKINVVTGQIVGGTLDVGMQIKFVAKIAYGDGLCYRTATDNANKNNYCIPANDLKEISLTGTPIAAEGAPKIFTTKVSTVKYDMRRGVKVGGNIAQHLQVSFTKAVSVAGVGYYVTARDDSAKNEFGIRQTVLQEGTPYSPITPLLMVTTESSKKINPLSGNDSTQKVEANTVDTYTSSTIKNNTTYYRKQIDENASLDLAIAESFLETVAFSPFSSPRWMTLRGDTYKVDLGTKTTHGVKLLKNRNIFFNSKITLNGVEYYRTAADTNDNNLYVIRASLVR